ncbi:MAG: hypothetical protein ABFS17_12480 [Chloroflexota bacterium]
MARRIICICMYLILIGLAVGCGSENQVSDEQLSLILTEVAEKQAAELALPLADSVVSSEDAVATPTLQPAPTDPPADPPIDVEWIDSASAGEHLGETITVRVEISHCDYKPGINGEPTFCNDQPYPNHLFTYLIWGEDWSHYDQSCVLVSGEIVEYDGKAQIELKNEEQIILCDGT